MTAVQEIAASREWYQVIKVGEELTKAVHEKLLQLLKSSESCFSIKSLAIHEISPIDKTLAESKVKEMQAVEEENVKKRLAPLRADRVSREQIAKKKETEEEIALNKLRHDSELDLAKSREEARMLVQKELADLLVTEAGRIAALPEKDRLLYLKEVVQSNGLTQRVIGIVEGIKGTLPDSILRVQQQRVAELAVMPQDQDAGNVATKPDQEKENAASGNVAKGAEPEQNKKPSEKDGAG